jgi:hypothetical protein
LGAELIGLWLGGRVVAQVLKHGVEFAVDPCEAVLDLVEAAAMAQLSGLDFLHDSVAVCE